MAGWVSLAVWTGIRKRKFLPPPAFEFRFVYHVATLCSKADELTARVPKIARTKISLARGVHYYPIFKFILPDQRLSSVKNIWLRCYQITLQRNVFAKIWRGATIWLGIYHLGAGLAVTGRTSDTGKNILQSFQTGSSSSPSYCHIFLLIAFLHEVVIIR
jgi:hypothetical protein